MSAFAYDCLLLPGARTEAAASGVVADQHCGRDAGEGVTFCSKYNNSYWIFFLYD